MAAVIPNSHILNQVVLTDPAIAVRGAIERAQELAVVIPNSHILNQVDIVCFGVGSGGTCTGVGRFLKEKNPNIKVYPVEPFESSVINGLSHSPHKIQGMGIGMIPEVLDQSLYTEALRVHSDDAIAMAKRLAIEEAILGGISSGANVCAAIQLAKRPENRGKLIVTTVNSFGERYLSTALYSEIREKVAAMDQMTLEESIASAKAYLGI
ncbi:unnamed protein product [Heligmosomoides polygyrus]|uniref:Tryptophan synthase beta chain-like PALP domain-containing protein n=1 Tax=Heligmosomoides polygyrus TaxID=6339 RepID=A0A3P7ZV58_HELPZ|nr:unnamed protein product [Heligmosomoides polygyrus]